MQCVTTLSLSICLEEPIDEEVVFGFPQIAVEVTRHTGRFSVVDSR